MTVKPPRRPDERLANVPLTIAGLAGERWGDLGVRVVSGVVLAAIGVVAVLAGGLVFEAMTVLVFALMVWELAGLTQPGVTQPGLAQPGVTQPGLAQPGSIQSGPNQPDDVDPGLAQAGSSQPGSPWLASAGLQQIGVAVLAGLGIFVAQAQGVAVLALGLAPAVLVISERRDRALLASYTLVMLVAACVIIALDRRGAVIVVWLVCIVVASDVCGYFAGRLLGGPRFWPAISPKKTWSGTVAGWFGAALVGLSFVIFAHAGWGLVLISPLVALAGQLGDIVESLIKRRAGVKDVSQLIPGHGGMLDRFDALIGAILAVGLLELFLPLPLGGI